MLDITKRGTVQVGSTTWEYHGDDENDVLFYVTPVPTWTLIDGLPAVELVTYETSDSTNGSGYGVLQVELGVPADALPAIEADIKTRFNVAPQFLTLPLQSGTIVNLTLPDGEGGTTGVQASGTDFGSNAAIFQVGLSADQLKTITTAMSGTGGSPFVVQYSIVVPARMPAVTVTLAFDSKTALNYQVTAHEHTHWAHSSSWTYDISKSLAESDASSVTVTPSDPNLPSTLLDSLRTWGQATITELVKNQVQAALQLEESASGNQSFTATDIASFSEVYAQSEVVMWRLQPQAVLPSFGDLGLTVAQIATRETTVNKLQFVLTITPQCRFSAAQALPPNTTASPNPLLDPTPINNLSVTVDYPSLTADENRTFVFTGNTPHTWVGDWDATAQGNWTIQYTATYADANNTQARGTATGAETQYTLGLADLGTLSVNFNASKFFATGQSWSSLIDSIIVDFAFNIPGQPAFLQQQTLNATDSPAIAIFKTLYPVPVTTNYVYQVTYVFKSGVSANPYTSDAKVGLGSNVTLFAPDYQQAFNVVVDMTNAYMVTINFFYDDTPYFPDIPASAALPAPTSGSPIQVSFSTISSAADASAGPWRRVSADAAVAAPADPAPAVPPKMATVEFFAAGNLSPVSVQGTFVLTDFSQVVFGKVEFLPQNLSLMVFSPTKEFTIVSFDPSIVDWTNLNSIEVHLRSATVTAPDQTSAAATIGGGDTPQYIKLDPQKKTANKQYFLVSGLPENWVSLSVEWFAAYVYTTGVKYASGTQEGSVINLPGAATETTPPGVAPAT